MSVALTVVAAGVVLVLGETFTQRPWQAGVALGLLLVVCGGAAIADRGARR